MNKIDKLTKNDILHGKLPLEDLLKNSFYYPACDFDGGVVKFFAKEHSSFIYCDYARVEDVLLGKLNTFLGYRILGNRALSQEELVPNGWNKQAPYLNMDRYKRCLNKKPFAHWAVFERTEEFDENHGPKRFSLMYIAGEGVATYEALYCSNKISAKSLAIIQPGTGFGGNWTDFRKEGGPLWRVIMNNTYGSPDRIYYGGVMSDYMDLNWDNYEFEKAVRPYYRSSPFGKVTIWKKLKSKS
jgi:hypothetical protein